MLETPLTRLSDMHGIELKGDLILAPVLGETQGGIGTRALLKTWFPKQGIWPDMTVVPETYGHAVITVNTGNLGIQINVYGETKHVSRAEEEAIDALKKVIKVIEAIHKELGVGQGLTYK